MSEFCNLSNPIHYTEDTTWLEEASGSCMFKGV